MCLSADVCLMYVCVYVCIYLMYMSLVYIGGGRSGAQGPSGQRCPELQVTLPKRLIGLT